MKSTKAYEAKRALFAALKVQAAPGMQLDGIQVAYSYPPNRERRVIYGGGVRFTTTDMAGEQGLVASEATTVGVYLRVLLPGETVEAAEAEVERLADTITALFAADPDLGGQMTWMGVQAGSGDYAETPDGPEAVLSLQVLVGAVLT